MKIYQSNYNLHKFNNDISNEFYEYSDDEIYNQNCDIISNEDWYSEIIKTKYFISKRNKY